MRLYAGNRRRVVSLLHEIAVRASTTPLSAAPPCRRARTSGCTATPSATSQQHSAASDCRADGRTCRDSPRAADPPDSGPTRRRLARAPRRARSSPSSRTSHHAVGATETPRRALGRSSARRARGPTSVRVSTECRRRRCSHRMATALTATVDTTRRARARRRSTDGRHRRRRVPRVWRGAARECRPRRACCRVTVTARCVPKRRVLMSRHSRPRRHSTSATPRRRS